MHQHDQPGRASGRYRGGAVDPVADPHGPGMQALEMYVAEGGPTLDEAQQLFLAYWNERELIADRLHELKGNAFVEEAMSGFGEAGGVTDRERLLAWTPTDERGEDGEAAWLLLAARAGFVGARGQTRKHLEQFVKGARKFTSHEKAPGTRRKVNGKEVWDYKDYPIKLDDAPILSVLVAVVRAHIAGLARNAARELFDVGTMLRADPGYGGSDHTRGAAADLHGMRFDTAADVIAVLEKLPPGAVAKVFPDKPGHLHLAIVDGAYEIGLPFGGDFFPSHLDLEERQAKHPQGSKVGERTRVDGLFLWSDRWCSSTGTWNGTAWGWTTPAGGKAKAVDHLASDDLKAAIAGVTTAD